MSTTSGSRDYGRFDELAEEFAGRYRRGERPGLQEYVDRLPEMADEIREMFPAMVEVERADGDLRDDVIPPPPVAPHLSQIGDYRILREVGRGGMGVVYEAEQVSLGRRVALKVLPGHVTGDRQALERFRREAKSAARLHHTNIVPVFEVGRDRDVSFYAMQLIQGQGLDQVFEELRRLREPGRKANGREPARFADPGPVATVVRPRVDAASILQKRALVQMTERLLTGRLAVEGPDESGRGEAVATGLAGTERFDPDSTSGLAPDAPGRKLPPSLAPTASGVSSSAVMPGGKHVSEVDTSGRRLPFFRSVAQIGRQTAQGLAYAHARGIVHRDIKPSNLLLDTEGVVWITDFGLAKADDDGMSASGDILGTLRYMAPERFRGEGDARADIYALGLTLYELLTLRPAYDSTDRLRLIEKIKNEEPVRPRSIDPRMPRDLETIVLKAIDKHPDHRYPTAVALAEDLRRFLADEPIKARQVSTSERYWRWARRNPVVAALGGVLAAVLVIATIGSLLTASRFAKLAEDANISAKSERGARLEADGARTTAVEARKASETSRAAALAETYRAMLSEVKALRAGHPAGWRHDALRNLARLTTMSSPRRDLVELRSEAVASLGEFDVVEVARLEGFRDTVWSLDFSPDSRALATATLNGDLHHWDVERRRDSWQVGDPAGKVNPTGWPSSGAPHIKAQFLPDGGLARISWGHRVEFLDPSGRPSARPPIDGGAAQAVALKISRRGPWLAVGWDDGRIGLHDSATGELRRTIKADPSVIALSPDGRWLASVGPDQAVLIRPTAVDGPPVTLGRHHGSILSLTFSPDGATLASTSWDQTATLWDVDRREERLTLRGHKEKVTDLAFSPDGNWVATTSHDHTARIWDARTGQTLAVLPGGWFVQAVAFSPDGQYLAIGVVNRTGRLYQIRGRRERRWLVGHANGTNSLTFHPHLARLASGADDHHFMVWDAESARPLRRQRESDSGLDGIAYSPDGSLLATGGSHQGQVRLWDAETGSPLRVLSGHANSVHALAFDPEGRRLATGDNDGVLILWDVATGQILRRETVGPSWIWSIAFVDGGRRLVTEVSYGPLVVYDLEGTDPPRRVAVPGGMRRFVVDRARNDLIVAGGEGMLTRVALPDLTPGHHLEKGHDGPIESLALHPGGRLLATGGEKDRRIILRDATTFEPLLTLPAWTGMVKDLAFDATGRWLAIAGADSDVGLWDLGLVRDELAAVGLAWDQPAPRVVSPAELASIEERPRSQVPDVRPFGIDPAEFQEARRLLNSGVAAFQRGRFADAAADLQAASERFQAIRHSNPGDPVLIRLQGISLGSLAGSLHDSKRPGEALARFRESLAVYGSLGNPNPGDLYNMACGCAMVSALEGRGSSQDREKLEARAVEYLRRAIAGDMAHILPQVATDHSLDPLRRRADFRNTMADAGFPSDPFTQPSPIAIALATPEERKIRGEALIAEGRTRDAIPYLASAWEANPADSILLLQVAALQAWFHQDTELAANCRKAREYARGTRIPLVADSAAKSSSLRPPDDPTYRAATLALARLALKLGKDDVSINWFRTGLGIAEYRAGHDVAAAEALRPQIGDGQLNISVTSALYLAMSLSRQGKEDEARRVATEAISRMRPPPLDEDNPLAGGAYHDDLIQWMAYKEAKALLKLDSAPASEAKPKGQ